LVTQGSVEEWLHLLRLEEYGPALHQQGYQTVEEVTQLTWEDLEDIGIVKLGHQKKILLAIKRVKDVRAGKRFPLQLGTDIVLTNLPPHPGQTQVCCCHSSWSTHCIVRSAVVLYPSVLSYRQKNAM
jgi:hypothetical protein